MPLLVQGPLTIDEESYFGDLCSHSTTLPMPSRFAEELRKLRHGLKLSQSGMAF
jgi:hypothetical protein